jgi:Skp family chaperone for outer membrane proteins
MLKRFTTASFVVLATFGLPVGVLAQQAAPEAQAQATVQTPSETAQAPATIQVQSPVLTVNQQRLFEESDFGKSSLLKLEADSRGLQVEIRKIESDLEIEERMLTERRASLSPAEFQPMARAFDDKVEKIRSAWAAKDRDLKRQREQDQQTFLASAAPILAELMQEAGAILLVDQSTVIISFDRVDITKAAIERINARLAQTPAVTDVNPATAPEAVTDPTLAPGVAPSPTVDTPQISQGQKP